MYITNSLPKRAEVMQKYTWILEHLYKTDQTWESEYQSLAERIPTFSKYKGTVSATAQNLLDCLTQLDALSEELDRLYVYANMKLHEDSTCSKYQGYASQAETLSAQLSACAAFLEPELIHIPPETLEHFLSSCPQLEQYRHYLENILRKKEHTLSDAEETLLAETEAIARGPQSIFTMLNDADIKFPQVVNEKGNTLELTKGNYTTFLESASPYVRRAAFQGLYKTYLKQKNTLAATYAASVKKDVFYAKIRKYSSSMEYALTGDNIPVEVYHNLIQTVHDHIPLLHRYVCLRKKMLGLNELHMYDLYTPLVPDATKKISYEQAKKIVLEALAPLGEAYQAVLREGFEGGWIDVYENVGKRGGAYSWGAYPGHPYVLLNYHDNLNSVFTLAHEMGHALHSYFTWKKQPYVYSGHKIFVAEVASTVNEALLMEYLLKHTTSIIDRKYLINYYLEQFRGTLFRQTMFAEFEKITHEKIEQGGSLTLESLCRIYHDLNVYYFGKDIVVDKLIDIEWARIPHFYNAFYVYQYATGYSAAITLSKKILEEGQPAVQKYLDFLSKGDSQYPIDLLKGAGVDMSTPEPIQKALAVFSSLLDIMERCTVTLS